MQIDHCITINNMVRNTIIWLSDSSTWVIWLSLIYEDILLTTKAGFDVRSKIRSNCDFVVDGRENALQQRESRTQGDVFLTLDSGEISSPAHLHRVLLHNADK